MQTVKNWGNRPWSVEFQAKVLPFPDEVEVAVVGGGFTGLAAAAWLKRIDPRRSVALLDAERIGSGASGFTGGLALAESAVGDLPGLDDVLGGYAKILKELQVDGDLNLPGVYELGRSKALENTPMRWKDSGELCAVKEMEGGTIHPGKVVSGLGRAAEQNGVILFENARVEACEFGKTILLKTAKGNLSAKQALFATNAFSLELTNWKQRAESCFTIAIATEEVAPSIIEEIGMGECKPFYTVDLPYLWGRLLGRQIVFGAGLVHFDDWREMMTLDVEHGESAEAFTRLEQRVHQLHPVLRDVKITHRWGGPICIAEGWRPIFEFHAKSDHAIVLGAYSGHGVAQSVYLGAWAAEILTGKRGLPDWE